MMTAWGRESEIAATFTAWGLSRRQQEVALLALAGMSVCETAAFLGLSHNTVKWHRQIVFAKAGIASGASCRVLPFGRRLVARQRARRALEMRTT